MPFIIEGPDGVGKTTLAHRIVKHCEELDGHSWPVYYSHMTKPSRHWDYYQDYILRMQPFAVQDRFHYGAHIYGNCLGLHPCSMTEDRMRLLEARLDLMGSYRLVIIADPYWLKTALVDKPKVELFNEEQILAANSAYSDMVCEGDPYGDQGGVRFSTRPDFIWTAHRNHGYVDDVTIEFCVREWFRRLEMLYNEDHTHKWAR